MNEPVDLLRYRLKALPFNLLQMPARRRAYRFVAVAAIALVAATTAQAAEIKRIGGDGIGDRVIAIYSPKARSNGGGVRSKILRLFLIND
jgi:hypothetical protein